MNTEHQQQYVPLLLLTDEFGPLVQPSQILQSRVKIRGTDQIPQVKNKVGQMRCIQALLHKWDTWTVMRQSNGTAKVREKNYYQHCTQGLRLGN